MYAVYQVVLVIPGREIVLSDWQSAERALSELAKEEKNCQEVDRVEMREVSRSF